MSTECSDVCEATLALENIWLSIGYSDKEKLEKKMEIERIISETFAKYLQDAKDAKSELENLINQRVISYNRLLKALENSNSEPLGFPTEGTLKEKFDFVDRAYKRLLSESKNQIEQFGGLQQQVCQLFNQLGVGQEERGEYSVVGDLDLSNSRLLRFKSKIVELQNEVKTRLTQLSSMYSSILTVSSELEYDLPNDINVILDKKKIDSQSMKKIQEFYHFITKSKEERLQHISRMANEITRMWELLNVGKTERQAFLQSHSTLSDSVIKSCEKEIQSLRKKMVSVFPSLIHEQQGLIEELCSQLNIEVNIRPFESFELDEMESVFNSNNTEIALLRKRMEKIAPILESINQREEMINEQDTLIKEANDRIKNMGKKPIDSKKVLKDENSLRRIKSLLPRLEKKLKILLIEYSEENNQPYIWNDVPYISHLDHVFLSDIELKKAFSNKQKPRVSLDVKSIDTNSKKDVIRRHSENNVKCSNV